MLCILRRSPLVQAKGGITAIPDTIKKREELYSVGIGPPDAARPVQRVPLRAAAKPLAAPASRSRLPFGRSFSAPEHYRASRDGVRLDK